MTGLVHEAAPESVEWYTPPEIFTALKLQFDLDPCAPALPEVPWLPAKRRITPPEDGLAAEWEGKVWLNPPYGAVLPYWLRKLTLHGNGVALLFARTDTAWFHDAVTRAQAVCFMRSRVRFIQPGGERGGSPGAGSMLLAYGDECAEAVRRCRLGVVMAPIASEPRQEWLFA